MIEPNNETIDESSDTMTLPDGTVIDLHYNPDRKSVPVKDVTDEQQKASD